jgi:hypothetical protein
MRLLTDTLTGTDEVLDVIFEPKTHYNRETLSFVDHDDI